MDFRSKLEQLFEEEMGYKDKYVFDSAVVELVKEHLIPHRMKIPILYRYSNADYKNIRGLEKG